MVTISPCAPSGRRDPDLRLRHVRPFLEIANAESVTLAADALNVTRTAVSRSLRELEEILKTQLFDRVGRRLRLKAAGQVIQTHAAAAMAELTRGRDRLGAGGDTGPRLAIKSKLSFEVWAAMGVSA